jgi:hypothetical protein
MASIHKTKTSASTNTTKTSTNTTKTGTNTTKTGIGTKAAKDAMAAWRRKLRRRSQGGFKSRDALEDTSRSWLSKWS